MLPITTAMAPPNLPRAWCVPECIADDGIKAKLSVALEVLSDIKHVFKEDAGLDLNFRKTKLLVKGISALMLMQHNSCLPPTPPSRTSVPCSLPRPL